MSEFYSFWKLNNILCECLIWFIHPLIDTRLFHLLATLNNNALLICCQSSSFDLCLDRASMLLWGEAEHGDLPAVFLLEVCLEFWMLQWCLDTTAGPWHSCENVHSVLPSPRFAKKDFKGQSDHKRGDLRLHGYSKSLCKWIASNPVHNVTPDLTRLDRRAPQFAEERLRGWTLGAGGHSIPWPCPVSAVYVFGW